MAEPPMLTIRGDFRRLSADELAPFSDASTGVIVDAQGRRGGLPHWIKPVSKATRFVGTALTVRTRPMDNLAPYAALKVARPGDVLVVSVDGGGAGSVMGDILLGMARNAGIVAAVTDGLVRDIAGINAVGIPTFALGLSPNSPFKDGPGEVGLPITIGGAIIEAGDLIVGDADGVVIVPSSRVEETARGLAEVRKKESTMDAAVRDGETYPAWLDGLLASDRVRMID